MGELLHAGALATTALGACCVAVDRRRRRAPELVAAAVMLAAMIDVVAGVGILPGVWWAAVIGVVALVGAASIRRRADPSGERTMRAVDAVGAILMGALMLLMSAPAGPAIGGHHVAAGSAPAASVVLAAAVYAAVAVGLSVRMAASRWIARLPPAAMGASVLLLAIAVLAG